MSLRSPWLGELPERLLVGTSSFSSEDWRDVFYPSGLAPADRLSYYATCFPTVEIDATFYAMPAATMLSNWFRRTPDGFLFALKVPREITHDAALEGADAATAILLDRTAQLGDKLAALLLQFPYVAKGADAAEYADGRRFLARLAAFLDRWAGAAPWVVEVRNAGWLEGPLLPLLRQYRIPLALTAYYTMPTLGRLLARDIDPLTGPFAYVRFIGDRGRIERRIDQQIAAGEKTRRFDEIVLDRDAELRNWVENLLAVVTRVRTLVYFNNHYAGFGPGSARRFAELWREIHAP